MMNVRVMLVTMVMMGACGGSPAGGSVDAAGNGDGNRDTDARTNRDCYAQGALTAAKFLVGKKPKLYGMNDVLGLA